mgnify:CR=1 FL=1
MSTAACVCFARTRSGNPVGGILRADMAASDEMTPLERVEALYQELVDWYGEGSDRELRAASKLLMVALLKLQQHGGIGWQGIVEEYLLLLKNDPQRYQQILDANRGQQKQPTN